MIRERLSEVRKDHGDKQADLARKLNVAVSTVRSWEQGKSSPPHEMLVCICRLYQVSADYLLGLSDIDPAYVQRQRLESFTQKELAALRDYEAYLMWRRRNVPRESR